MKENGKTACRNIYGSIPGKEVGVIFLNRRDLYCIHNSISPIAIGPEGPLSVLLLRNQNLNDHGYVIGFTTGESQKFMGDSNAAPEGQFNRNLMISIRSQLPIRIVRASFLKNCFAPSKGFRYDGLYCCKSYETHMVRNKLVFKFLLSRLENQPPVPWEDLTVPSCSGSNDVVEITSEPPYNKIVNERDALNFEITIGESFCLKEEEYSQIEMSESPTVKEEAMDIDSTNETFLKERKPLVLSSDRVYTVESDVDSSTLANLLLASGVISKEVRIGESKQNCDNVDNSEDIKIRNHHIYDFSDDYTDSECEDIKMEFKTEIIPLEKENESTVLPESDNVEQPYFKKEELSPMSNENQFENNDLQDSCDESETPMIKMEISSPLINSMSASVDSPSNKQIGYLKDTGSETCSFGHQNDSLDNFLSQSSTEPVEVITVNNSSYDASREYNLSSPVNIKPSGSPKNDSLDVIRIKMNDSPEFNESLHEKFYETINSDQTLEYIYKFVKNGKSLDGNDIVVTKDNIHLVRTGNANGTGFVMVSPKYLELLNKGHMLTEDETEDESKNITRPRPEEVCNEQTNNVVSGITTLAFDGDDCVMDSVNDSHNHSDDENGVESVNWWCVPPENLETDNKIKPPSPHSSDYDIKINPNNFKSLGVEASSVYCKKCTPPPELIEPLLGKLSSLFSFFYSDFFCKCKSDSSASSNNKNSEYFKRITNLVVELKNKNVQYVSAIVAFLLYGSQADIVHNVESPVNQNTRRKGKRKLVLQDSNNAKYNLIETDGKFSLIRQNDFDSSSTERIELDSVAIEGELISAGSENISNIDYVNNTPENSSKRSLNNIHKPARKRRTTKKGVRNVTTLNNSRHLPNTSVGMAIPQNSCSGISSMQDTFLGFNEFDVQVSEIHRNLSIDAMSLLLVFPSTFHFKGFTRNDLKKCRTREHSFIDFMKNKHKFSKNNT